MILTGKQPEDEQQPVESVKLETGTRLGTVKLTVDGKTTDNILIKGLAKKNLLGNLNDKYAAKDHKHKEYLKPSEVNITGTGQNGEVVFTEATPLDTTNGTLTLKMKEGQQFERIIDLPFTGLKHLAFADKLTSYPDEMASSFYNDMCTDLNLDLEFVSTTRSSTITGGSLTIQSSGGVGGNLTCEDITADDITAGGNATITGDIFANDISATGAITATSNVTGAGFVVPNTTNAGTKFLLADGTVDSYGRAWYMKRGVMYTGNVTGTRWMRAASLEMESAFSTSQYSEIILAVHDFTSQKQVGILALSYGREGSATSPRAGYNYAKWIVKTADIDITRFVLAYDFTYTSTTATSKAYLYVKMTGAWQQFIFAKISEGEWSGVVDRWVLNTGNTTSTYNYTTIPETNQVISTDISYAATAGNVVNMQFTGTCDTADSAQQKEATVDSSFTLTEGVIVSIKFANTNTFSATAVAPVTLNVNNTGAKQIWYNTGINTGTSTGVYGYAGRYITYIYDSVNDVWVWVSRGYDSDTNTQIRVYRQTSGYNADYPILVSRTVAGSIGTVGTNSSYSAVYGVIFNTDQPTINPNTGKMKVKALAVNGVDITGNSDERLKDIQGNVSLSIEDIANAPSILYKRKDSDDEKVHIGSIAQYWEKIAPWAVGKDNDGMLTLDYPALSLAASIQCAREIVDLKKRIEKPEERL